MKKSNLCQCMWERNKYIFVKIVELFRTSFTEFFRDKSFIHGASLAYFTLLALVPILYIAYATIGRVLGQERLIKIIAEFAQEHVGMEDIDWLMDLLGKLNVGGGSVTLEIFGIVILAFSASAIFNSMRASINTFFGIRTSQMKLSFWDQVKARLMSFLLLTITGLIFIMVYFLETAFVSFGAEFLGRENTSTLAMLSTHFGSIVSNAIIFFFVFKYLHDGLVHWKIAIRGALFTGTLLFIGQWLIKFYLTNYFFAVGGGVAGTIFILLVWVFYSAQIIFLGAKITKVYADMLNMPIVPRKKMRLPNG
jgi:membrane protein